MQRRGSRRRRGVLAAIASGTAAALAGCASSDGRDGETTGAVGENGDRSEDSPGVGIRDETLTLTTTTSTYDTGLLDELNLAFRDRYGVEVEAVAQGTGAALETGRRGDADVVLVHARSLEDEFISEGYGVNRRDLMVNDFVVVGPEDDPAGIDGAEDVTDAFRSVAEAESAFVSRGDNSGTHAKERTIWDATGIEPSGEWYREAGSGMGEVLNQANQSGAYTVADRGSYVTQRSRLQIGVRVEGPIEGGPELLANPYGIVAVNPGVHENINYDLSMAYIGFLTSSEGQRIIQEYTVEGKQLFFPNAVSDDPDFEQYVPENWTR